MFNAAYKLFGNIIARHGSSFLSSLQIFSFIRTRIRWLWSIVSNFLVNIFWVVVKFILGIVDALEYVINNLLGIGSTIDDYTDYAKSLNISGNRDYLKTLVKTFRAIVAVAIVLLLIFTIIAIIKQEVNNAQNNFEAKDKSGKSKVGNNKGSIIMKLFKNLLAIVALPVTMIFIIAGVNSILTAFSTALKGEDSNITLGGQVLAASTYDANKYRMYANAGKRIPIIVKAYDQYKYSSYETQSLIYEIKNLEVQTKLRNFAEMQANGTYLSFEKSLSYKNNKFYNSTDFGDYYEQFICTPEQYQVMADFIDYIQKNALNYYIKSLDDPNVEWKYVEDVVYKQSTNELNITYKDNSDLNKNGSTKDCYTLTLSPKNEVTSPISDALDSIMAMLGVGDYGNNRYNTMERDESGDFMNLVQWANEKCYIHFSDHFVKDIPDTWSDVDEILMYEYYRFSANNTLSDFTFEDLTTNDVNAKVPTLDVMEIVYRTYYPEADVYSSEKAIPCVLINGNYYLVEQSKTKTDKFGNALYEIVSQKELNENVNVRYLDPSYTVLKTTTEKTKLKISAGFNINKRNTWTLQDEVLVYEYFKNNYFTNDLSKYGFDDLRDTGADLIIYKIKEYQANVNEKNFLDETNPYTVTEKEYVCINGTFYQLTKSGSDYMIGNGMPIPEGSEHYLLDSENEVKSHYNYYLKLTNYDEYGFANGTKTSAESFVHYFDPSLGYSYDETFSDLNLENANDSKYANFVMQLSENFDYKNTDTWSYRDYFIFYMYIKHNIAKSYESLKYVGVEGSIKKTAGKYCFVLKTSSESSRKIYFYIDEINAISELNINSILNLEETKNNNNTETNENVLFVTYDPETSSMFKEGTETKVFRYSDYYSYYDVTTWKMVDLILNYFSSLGIINNRSYLESAGYGALKYEIKVDGKVDDVIYKFGSNTNFYCLSEKNLKNYRNINGNKMNITSIDEFLETDVIKFICSYNCLIQSSVISSFDDISETLFQDYENFVLDTKNLIDILVEDNFNTDITRMGSYTYSNIDLDANDPSTWTALDLAYYAITGRIQNTYSGNIIQKSDGSKYFIIKNKALLISGGGKYAGTLSEGDTPLKSKKFTCGNTLEVFKQSYADNIEPLLKTNQDLENLSSLNSFKYSYTSGKEISLDSYVYDPNITVLDAIILSSQGSLQNKTYYFNVFTDGTNEYLNVYGNYIRITREASGIQDNITYNPNSVFTLTNTAKVFSKLAGNYSSFYEFNADNKKHRNFSYLDCLIYAETGSIQKAEYPIYKIGTSEYLFVNKKFIKVTNENKQSKNQADSITVSDSLEKKKKNIDYLYDNYYKNYVVSSAKFEQSTETVKLKYKTTFDVNERNSWSPIALILYKNGYITGNGIQEIQEGTDFKKSLDGSKTYFIYSVSNVVEGEKTIVIDITDIGYIDEKNPDDDTEIDAFKYLREKDTAIYELNLHLYAVIDNAAEFLTDDDGNPLTIDEIVDKNTAYADATFDSNILNKDTLKFEFGNANNFNTEDVKTWTWIDLIYYYLFNTTFNGTDYYVYYSANNEYFVELTDGTTSYYIEFNNYSNNGTTFDLIDQSANLTKTFVQTGTDIFTYNPGGSNTTLAFVAYKLTNKTSPALDKFEFTTNNTDKTFYFVRNVFTNKLCGIYKLTNGTTEIESNETPDYYIYETTNDSDVSSWSVFDFIVYYANGFTGNNVYNSKLKTVGVNQYFVIDTNYINITALSRTFNGAEIAVRKDGTTLVSTRSIKSVGFGEGETIFTGYQSPMFLKHTSIAESDPIKEAILKIKPSNDSYTNDNEIKNAHTLDAQLFKFSKGFQASDFSTWTVSDLMIYYAFKNGFYQVDDATGTYLVSYLENYIDDNEIKTRKVTREINSKNFQNFVTIGGAPGYVYYIISTDEYGNSKSNKVINFSNEFESVSGIYYNYDVFSVLYGRSLVNIVTENNTANGIDLKMTEIKTATEVDPSDVPSFIYSVSSENVNVDFTFKDYYYFNFNYSNLLKVYPELKKNFTTEDINAILNYGKADGVKIKGTLNIKLSDGFKIDDLSTWTLFDLIVVYEYSKSIEGNEFRDASFEDMMTIDNYFLLYGFGDSNPIDNNKLILQINGNYYNLASFVEKVKPDDENDLEYRLKAGIDKPSTKTVTDDAGNVSNIISTSNIRSHTMKTLFQKINLTLNVNYGSTTNRLIYDFNENEKSFNYSDVNGDRIYRRIYTNTESLYKVDFSDPMFSKYSISSLVKKVSWPEKIMNDMQVMYPDLNWGTLIATDGWLDTLGEFTSAYANGQFISKNNSSNTTAAGLVLSEFFLSVSKEATDGYGNYEYQTLFDENVIKSLMLSLLGEENYATLSSQATIFVEMFNSSFAKILDNIAEESEIEIIDGQVNNFTMCVYKSYLATVLLSSDIGEYLYTIATRVYAQYTIYESLANACGDYAGYYAFTTGQKDSEGNETDRFKYASFRQLVKYENLTSGQASPIYTFKMEKAYEAYAKKEHISIPYDPSNFDIYYFGVYNFLDEYYKGIYEAGGRVSDKDDLYCFMFDAYYTMKRDIDGLNVNMPSYLELYKQYLDGTIDRWEIACDVSVTDTEKYIQDYKDYVKARKYAKIFTHLSLMKFYMGKHYHEEATEEDADKNFFEKVWDGIKQAYNTLFFGKTPIGILNQSLAPRYQAMLKKFKNLTSIFGGDDFDSSEAGSEEHWNEILEINDNLDELIEETNNVRNLQTGNDSPQNKTKNGSTKKFLDEYYDDALLALNNIKTYLANYVSAQKMIDRIAKASITFSLAQFGQNYVTSGFDFNIENRNYTFDPNLSATRLAEYVYGGAYLKKFNVKPTYTSEDYTGIIYESRTFDKKSATLKIDLEMWPELRKFASELANYTSKLYYQTNLKNIAANVSDGVLLTDYVNVDIYLANSNSNHSMTATSEFLMLYYLINNSSIDVNTYIRLMFADTIENLERMECDETSIDFDKIKKLALAIETGNWDDFTKVGGELNEESLKGTLVDYLIYIFSEKYDSFGYYNSGNTNPAQRIHKVFKNVISYLLVTEDSENAESENALNLENLSFKDFKILLMEKLVDYQQNPSETAKENTARYLTIFELISSNFMYNASAEDIGTVLRVVDLDKTDSLENETPTPIKYLPLASGQVYADFKLHVSTKNNILNLAGLANRPIEELVNLEYDKLYDRNGNYDEASGDVFVVCSYDELTGKYIPYMARSYDYENIVNSKYDEYVNKYGVQLKTEYYDDTNAYPIIAKGIFNSQGMPTAIKIQDNNVIFYRTTILATGSVNEDSVQTTMGSSQVNTVSYTKTVESTSYKKLGIFNGKATSFLGSIDMKTYVNSKVDPYFLQNDIEYNLSKDEYGGISVLDDFSAHYVINGQSYFLFIMSFVTLVPFLFNASAAVLRRILDLIFLILIGPLMISMRSLDVDEMKTKRGEIAFNNWKGQITQALMSAFGFVLGFRIYYILVSSVLTMSFVSDATLANITRIGGLSFLNKATVNALLRYLYVLAAITLIRSSADTILNVITARFGQEGSVTDMLASPLGGRKPIDAIKEDIVEGYKKDMAKLNDIISGQALVDMKNAAFEQAKTMIPGSGIVERSSDIVKGISDRAKGLRLQKRLKAAGVDKKVAKQARKSFVDSRKKQRENLRNRRIESANRFMQEYVSGLDNTFSSTSPKKNDKKKKK